MKRLPILLLFMLGLIGFSRPAAGQKAPKPSKDVRLAEALKTTPMFYRRHMANRYNYIFTSKAKKEDKIEAEQERLDTTNRRLHAALDKYWKYTPDIQVFTEETQKAFDEAGSTDYNVFGLTWKVVAKDSPNPGSTFKTYKDEFYLSFHLNIERKIKRKSFGIIGIASDSPKISDLYMLVRATVSRVDKLTSGQYKSLKDLEAKPAPNNLKQKTLLICDRDFGKKFKPTDIPQYYPYKFKIATQAEIDAAILEENPEYIFAWREYLTSINYYYTLMDLASGEVIHTFNAKTSRRVKSKHFTAFKAVAEY